MCAPKVFTECLVHQANTKTQARDTSTSDLTHFGIIGFFLKSACVVKKEGRKEPGRQAAGKSTNSVLSFSVGLVTALSLGAVERVRSAVPGGLSTKGSSKSPVNALFVFTLKRGMQNAIGLCPGYSPGLGWPLRLEMGLECPPPSNFWNGVWAGALVGWGGGCRAPVGEGWPRICCVYPGAGPGLLVPSLPCRQLPRRLCRVNGA